MMSDKDRALLDGIREMEEQAPGVGLCSYPFKVVRREVERIIEERNALEELYQAAINHENRVD